MPSLPEGPTRLPDALANRRPDPGSASLSQPSLGKPGELPTSQGQIPRASSIPAPNPPSAPGSAARSTQPGSLRSLTERQAELVERLRSGQPVEWPRQPGRTRPVSGNPAPGGVITSPPAPTSVPPLAGRQAEMADALRGRQTSEEHRGPDRTHPLPGNPAPAGALTSPPAAGSVTPLTGRRAEMVEALRSGRAVEMPRDPGRAHPSAPANAGPARALTATDLPPNIKGPQDASAVFRSVLGNTGHGRHRDGGPHQGRDGGAKPGLETGTRHLPADRQANVADFVRQLRGGHAFPAPDGAGSLHAGRYDSRDGHDGRDFRGGHDFRDGRGGYSAFHWDRPRPMHPLHAHCNRAIRYPSRSWIPPILWASVALDYVYLDPIVVPDVYDAGYELAYSVDPASELSRDDILFRPGSTEFADALSYQIVEDLAYAIMDPSLAGMRFAIEGHASAEGSYEANLTLSQRRAERIAQELVFLGVEPERLIPVGYGETEARYPADAPEELRRLDRRVVVFRLEEEPGLLP